MSPRMSYLYKKNTAGIWKRIKSVYWKFLKWLQLITLLSVQGHHGNKKTTEVEWYTTMKGHSYTTDNWGPFLLAPRIFKIHTWGGWDYPGRPILTEKSQCIIQLILSPFSILKYIFLIIPSVKCTQVFR